MKSVSFGILAAALALVSGGGALAQRSNPALFAPGAAVEAKRMPTQQRDERRFLKDAAAAGRFETEASRLALGKSSDPGVRSFAATLINHHASASNELLYMLQARDMAAPMLANDQRKTLNRLAKLQGAKFDREFMQEIGLRYQKADVEYFERASQWARDPQIRSWIDRTLPTLRYHLATAERLVPADSKLARAGGDRYLSRASLVVRPIGSNTP